MREFKIRVWDVKDNDWFYTVPGRPEDHNVLDTHYFENVYQNEEDYIWEQYTGLKDKNGKEIYEGDILRLTREAARDKSTLYQVIWDEHTAAFDTKNLGKGWNIGYLNETAAEKDYKIIGNIHENPELLGAK